MIVIRRLAGIAALPTALLLLTACSGGDNGDAHAKAQPSQHPVFGQPLGRQVFLALRETQKSGSASFTQTVSFGSAKGTAVQTLSGRLDFTEGRVRPPCGGRCRRSTPPRRRGRSSAPLPAGRRARAPAGSSSTGSRSTTAPPPRATGSGTAATTSSPRGRQRPDRSPAGFREPGRRDPPGGLGRRGGEGTAGGARGGRTYRAEMPFSVGWTMFPRTSARNWRPRWAPAPSRPASPDRVRGRAGPDHPRPGGHVEAPAEERRPRRRDLADDGPHPHRVRLVEAGRAPAGSVRKAAEAVLPMRDVKNGGCVDFDTGRRATHVVVGVPCSGPYDARVFVQVPLRPGATAAETQNGPTSPARSPTTWPGRRGCRRRRRSGPGGRRATRRGRAARTG